MRTSSDTYHEIDFTECEECAPFDPVYVPWATIVTVLCSCNQACQEKAVVGALHPLGRLGTLESTTKSIKIDESHEECWSLSIGTSGSELDECGQRRHIGGREVVRGVRRVRLRQVGLRRVVFQLS